MIVHHFIKSVPVLVLLLASCSGSNKELTLKQMPLTEAVYASGTVKAYNQYTAYSNASGVLKQFYLSENDLVKTGQLIAEIDNEAVRYKLSNAELAFLEAERNWKEGSPILAQLEKELSSVTLRMKDDSLNYIRYQELMKGNATTLSELEKREIAYHTSRNRQEELLHKRKELIASLDTKYRTAMNTVQINMAGRNDYQVKSYIQGKVYRIFKKTGELVMPQEPLAVIGDAGQFMFELNVDESELGKVKAGQQVALTIDAYGDKVFQAKVIRILPYLDTKTRTFLVEAIPVDQQQELVPGMTVEANIIIQKKTQAYVLPKAYILPGDSVLLAEGKKKKIKPGLRNLEYVEVLSGLDTLETVIRK